MSQTVDYFYPRSPCGERHTTTITICIASKFLSTLSLRRATARRASRQQPEGISIHALLAESDRGIALPAHHRQKISIHALLAESDVQSLGKVVAICLFLSTLSLRRATARRFQFVCQSGFLSTLSLRRATIPIYDREYTREISIHALLAESDSKSAQNSGALLRI